MGSSAEELWNARFGEIDHYLYGTEPNAYLTRQAYRFQRGMRVLVPGDGEGRNGVWLAEQGLEVVTLDASSIGPKKAKALAESRGVALHMVQADLTEWTWPTEEFDAIVSIFLHWPSLLRTPMHRRMANALRPGGWMVIQAFTPLQREYQQSHQSGGPRDADMLFTAQVLREDFAELEIVQLHESVEMLEEGEGHQGMGAVVSGVFRKP